MEHQVDRVGQQVGNYRLEHLLGRGGFAEVYLGRHVYLESPAAIKLLHTTLAQADLEGFRAEAMTLVRLIHPHVVRILDFGLEGATPFLVMDFAPHGTLRQRHPRQQPLPLPVIVDYVKQVASALQYAHDQNIIHRDLKPENMLLGRQGDVLLSDFGIAVIAQSTHAGGRYETAGTITYMAPEQIQGRPRKASDQYALAIVVYEWLTGSPPFTDSFVAVAAAHLLTAAPSLREQVPTIAPEVEQVVLTALAKDPKQRFASVQAFAAALEQASQAGTAERAASDRFVSPPMAPIASRQELHEQEAVPLESMATVEGPSDAATVASEPRTAAVEPQAEPQRPWNVPFGRNPFFTGRESLLAHLHAQLSGSHRARLPHALALSGLGGIGKTQTATEYAYRYRQEYQAVFWVRAESQETLVADYVAIARLLSLPGQDAPDQLQIVAATKRWLEQHEGWLLILDNAEELALLTDFLPARAQGCLLLTTRAQATGRMAKSLSVDKMELYEGMQLLLRRAKLLEPDEPLDTLSEAVRTAAQQLVNELDGLPLALDQAGAYIEEASSSLSEYLELFERHRLALLQQQSTMGSDYPHTVASTWALSFEQVEQANPAAADLLRLCAFLHPDALPEAIFTEGAPELGPRFSPMAADPLHFNGAIQLLRRYSLVKRDPQARLLNVHRLVQVVLKESLDEAAQRQWAERAVRAVNRAFPEAEFVNWERCELCLPHALLCAQWVEQYAFTFPQAAHLLSATGHYLRERGRYAQAEPLLTRALALQKEVLDPEHVDAAITLNKLAWLYILQGNYRQAEQLLQPALATFERVLGAEHPEVATTLDNLAAIYLSEGQYAQAEPLFQRALAIREQVFGQSHPLVAESLNNLANLYYYQSQYALAEPLYRRALALFEHTRGPEHPFTLIILNNLGILYTLQGKYAQAEPLLQRTLTIQERVLGTEHPDIAGYLIALGRLYLLQGKYTQAEPLLQRALMLREWLLGPEHYLTIRALLHLAQLAQASGQQEQAESLYQQALISFERVLGPEHPFVAETLSRLAQFYTGQGRYKQAEPLLERAVTIGEQSLSPQHPQMATTLETQGYLALVQGREEQAEQLFQQALAIQEQTLGKAHPDVAHTLHHLAELYEKQGKLEQAQSLYHRTLSIREAALGPDHPDTLATQQRTTGRPS